MVGTVGSHPVHMAITTFLSIQADAVTLPDWTVVNSPLQNIITNHILFKIVCPYYHYYFITCPYYHYYFIQDNLYLLSLQHNSIFLHTQKDAPGTGGL